MSNGTLQMIHKMVEITQFSVIIMPHANDIKIMGSFSNTLSVLLQRLRSALDRIDENFMMNKWDSAYEDLSAIKTYLRLEENISALGPEENISALEGQCLEF